MEKSGLNDVIIDCQCRAAPGYSPTNGSWTFDSDWWVVTTLKKQAKMPL